MPQASENELIDLHIGSEREMSIHVVGRPLTIYLKCARVIQLLLPLTREFVCINSRVNTKSSKEVTAVRHLYPNDPTTVYMQTVVLCIMYNLYHYRFPRTEISLTKKL